MNQGGTRPPASWIAVGISIVGMALATLLHAYRTTGDWWPDDKTAHVTTAFMGVSVAIMFAAKRRSVYISALLARLLLFLNAAYYFGVATEAVALVLFGVLLELCLFEPYPLNLVLATTTTTLTCAVTVAGNLEAGVTLGEVPAKVMSLALLGYSVSVLGSRMILFREATIDLQDKNERLTESVVQLARANSMYQDYAATAEETAAEEERKRITRDIHDIVGYTLTNSIMLMEQALDMMQENPLGLPAVVETARSNAEDGLRQIREAMHRLRRQTTPLSTGIRAIHRLTSVFQKATGIRVRFEYGDVPWTISSEVDAALYHIVQESLVNSFRHGRATDIDVALVMAPGGVSFRIRDSGQGALEVVEGIGLKGMRERAVGLGGHLSAGNVEGGFLVEGLLRFPRSIDEDQDPDSR